MSFAHIGGGWTSGSGSGPTKYIRHGGMIVAKTCSIWIESASPQRYVQTSSYIPTYVHCHIEEPQGKLNRAHPGCITH